MQTNILRKIDFQGRINIPKQFRNQLNLNAEDELYITYSHGTLVITPKRKTCKICGSTIPDNYEMPICDNCLMKIIKDLAEEQ